VTRFLATLLAVTVLGLTLATELRAQASSDFAVVRYANRRGLIVRLLKHTLPDSLVGRPLSTKRFVLLDRDRQRIVALDAVTEVSPSASCPAPSAHQASADRICIPLAASAPALDDSTAYALLLDSIPVQSTKPQRIGAQTLAVEAVAGHVKATTGGGVTVVEVTYDVDLTPDTSLSMEVLFGQRQADVECRLVPGVPPCYKRGSLSFVYDVTKTPYHAGDKISARFAPGSSGHVPPGKISTTTIAPDTTLRDTTLFVQGGFTQTNSGRAASVQLRWQHWPIPGAIWDIPPHYASVVSPYVDALWTTDTTKSGYLNLGVQYTGYLSDLGSPLEQLVLAVTPRTESDQKVTVSNFMYLDGQVSPKFQWLFGSIPFARGSYLILPHGGIQLGRTFEGQSVARPETNDPSRWTGGVSGKVHFPAAKGTPWYCSFFGCAGVDLNVDWQHYWLNHVRPNAKGTNWNWTTVSAQYKFTRHLGLSASLNNGNAPPLFIYQRLIQVGLAFVD
jgi:hypothetical protein